MVSTTAGSVKKRHVLILSPNSGGAGSVAIVTRHHVAEIARDFSVILVSDSLPSERVSGVVYHHVVSRKFSWLRRFGHVPNEIAFALASKRIIMRLSREYNVCAVICHGHALATLAARLVKKKMHIPYAVVVHGDIFDRPPGTYDWRLTMFYKAVTPVAYRHADAVFAISPHIADCAKRQGASANAVEVIPNGIDPHEIGLNTQYSESVGTSPGENSFLRILYIGRFSVEKGVTCLIEACGKLRDMRIPFVLTLIGNGPQKQELMDLSNRLKLKDQVFFLGKVPRQELGAHFKAADVTCVPSLSEPQGLVVLESLIAETPVVGSNVGGIPSMIEPGRNGMLFPARDSSALAEIFEDLWKNPDTLATLKMNTLSSVDKRFSWPTIGRKLCSSLQSLCEGRKH